MNILVFKRGNEELGRVDLDTAIIRKRNEPARFTEEYQRLIDLWHDDPDHIDVLTEGGALVEDFPS